MNQFLIALEITNNQDQKNQNFNYPEKSSENLKQVLDYIIDQKLEDFLANKQALIKLLKTIKNSVENIC